MPPFRNPFVKRAAVPSAGSGGAGGAGASLVVGDENARPIATNGIDKSSTSTSSSSSSRPEYAAGSRASSALSLKSRREEPREYKLSVVNDSGVYLPPSPTEKKSFWQRTSSSTSSSHRTMLSDNEPFSISRESFESYRRSFDISARSPVRPDGSTTPRQSLESSMNRPSRSGVRNSGQSDRPQLTEEHIFEDVGLNDDPKLLPKKKRIFSRFGDNHEMPPSTENSRPNSSHRGFHIPGRKRGHSGQGAELGKIDRPPPKLEDDGIIR